MKQKQIAKFTILAIIYLICRYECDNTLKSKAQTNTETVQEKEYVDNHDNWRLLSDDTMATVYNAVPSQCNKDVAHTASMYKLNLKNVKADRVIAMERTMMAEYGIKYGDVVRIEGAGRWDGIWQVQDTMNKRFAGKHKIDILVPKHIRHGVWKNVRVYVPADEYTSLNAKLALAK